MRLKLLAVYGSGNPGDILSDVGRPVAELLVKRRIAEVVPDEPPPQKSEDVRRPPNKAIRRADDGKVLTK
jgi:hypothetical protein